MLLRTQVCSFCQTTSGCFEFNLSGKYRKLLIIHNVTEVRGWTKTGRPQQSYQSFKELKAVRCIVYGPQSVNKL